MDRFCTLNGTNWPSVKSLGNVNTNAPTNVPAWIHRNLPCQNWQIWHFGLITIWTTKNEPNCVWSEIAWSWTGSVPADNDWQTARRASWKVWTWPSQSMVKGNWGWQKIVGKWETLEMHREQSVTNRWTNPEHFIFLILNFFQLSFQCRRWWSRWSCTNSALDCAKGCTKCECKLQLRPTHRQAEPVAAKCLAFFRRKFWWKIF